MNTTTATEETNMTATEPKTIVIDLKPASHSFGEDNWTSDHVLSFTGRGGRAFRAKIGYVGPRGEGRQVHEGPMVPGPWAYAFNLGWCIAANPAMSTRGEIERNRAAGIEHDVAEGDLIRVPGALFRFEIERGEFPRLVLVTD